MSRLSFEGEFKCLPSVNRIEHGNVTDPSLFCLNIGDEEKCFLTSKPRFHPTLNSTISLDQRSRLSLKVRKFLLTVAVDVFKP
jgi:hypothetical protein